MIRLASTILATGVIILLILNSCGSGDGVSPSVIGAPGEEGSQPTVIAFATVVVLDPQAEPVLSRVNIMPVQVSLAPGQAVIMDALVFDATGTLLREVGLQWRVKDPRVGTINDWGGFLAGSTPGFYPGAIDVVATQETPDGTTNLSAEASVQIIGDFEPSLLYSLGLYPSNISVQPNQFIGLGAMGWDAQGRFMLGLRYKWSMEDPSAGSIDELGFLTAGEVNGRYPNSIKVTAIQSTPQGDVARVGFVSVTIVEKAETSVLTEVEITPDRVHLDPGMGVSFFAHAFDAGGRRLDDVSFEWVLEDPTAGSLSAYGRFTAGSVVGGFPDSVRVIATQESPNGTVSAEGAITVMVIEPRLGRTLFSAHVLPSSVALVSGQRFVFIGVIFDQFGKGIVAVNTTWEVVDPRAGSIDEFGIITAGATPGIYPDAVRAQVVHGDGPNPQITVAYATVGIIGELQRAEVQPRRLILRPGQTFFLSARGYDANGLPISPLRNSWTVVDPAAGTINAAGIFTAGDQPGVYVNAIKVVVTERQD